MPDPEPTPPPTPTLAERTLARLRKVATGNGLNPQDIAVYETEERALTIKGKLEVSPLCETARVSYPGRVKGQGRKLVNSFVLLQAAVEKHQKEFRESQDWVQATVKEIKAHETKGWGLESAKVTIEEKSAVYAATEVCPACQGRKTLMCEQCMGKGLVVCTQCQGQGRELCYNCNGRGEEPNQPGIPCHTCNATRYAPCRFCQSNGSLPCPTCNGKRGTPCTACQAAGAMTQEVAVICGAETYFSFLSEGLPSGLRRGLDRIGIANLPKGHADIEASEPSEEEENDNPDPRAKIPVLLYTATLPYAEMKMDLGGKKSIVSAVGKRCAITGVPNFLDHSLKPWRDKLRLAAFGHAPLEDAMGARAIKDVLSLSVAGHGNEKDVRRLYPFGLSSEVIGTVLHDIHLAVKKTTLKTRTIMALFCGAAATGFFYLYFVKGFEQKLMFGTNPNIAMIFDFAVLAASLAASWAVLNFSTRLALKSRFPQMQYALKQKTGKTGISMLGGITAMFILVLLLAPAKPLWLARFFAGF